MMREGILGVAILFAGLVLQCACAGDPVVLVDWTLLGALWFALRAARPARALAVCAAAGFTVEIIGTAPAGLHAVTAVACGAAALWMRRRLRCDEIPFAACAVAVLALSGHALQALWAAAAGMGLEAAGQWARLAAGTGLAVFPLVWVCHRFLGRWLERLSAFAP